MSTRVWPCGAVLSLLVAASCGGTGGESPGFEAIEPDPGPEAGEIVVETLAGDLAVADVIKGVLPLLAGCVAHVASGYVRLHRHQYCSQYWPVGAPALPSPLFGLLVLPAPLAPMPNRRCAAATYVWKPTSLPGGGL